MPAVSPFAAVSGDNSKRDEDRVTWGLLLIYLLSTVYVTAIATQAPMMPYLWDDLGGSVVGFGIMMSEFGALQLLGNLLSGPLLDTMGARFWYGISFLAAATVAAFTALATKPWMLYVSRLPAIFELAPLCAKVLITERSSEASRARMIGYNGVALGAGFVAGPTLGGFLSNRSNQLCAWIASALCLGSLLFVPLIRPVGGHAYQPFADAPDTPRSPPSLQESSDVPGRGPSLRGSLDIPRRVPSLRESTSPPRQASRALSHHLRMRSESGHDRPLGDKKGKLRAEGEVALDGKQRGADPHGPGVGNEAAVLASVGHFLPEAAGLPIAAAPTRVPGESGHLVGDGHWESDPESGRVGHREPQQKRKANLRQIWSTLIEPGVPSIVAVKVAVGLGLGVLQTTLSLLLDKHYHLPAQASGAFLSYVGVLAILVQGFLIGPISRNVSIHMVVLVCGWGTAGSFGLFALAGPSVWILLAPVGRKGTVLAIDAGIAGLMTMIAPSIGTGLYASVGFPSLGIFGACLTAVLMGLLHAGFVVV